MISISADISKNCYKCPYAYLVAFSSFTFDYEYRCGLIDEFPPVPKEFYKCPLEKTEVNANETDN